MRAAERLPRGVRVRSTGRMVGAIAALALGSWKGALSGPASATFGSGLWSRFYSCVHSSRCFGAQISPLQKLGLLHLRWVRDHHLKGSIALASNRRHGTGDGRKLRPALGAGKEAPSVSCRCEGRNRGSPKAPFSVINEIGFASRPKKW